MKEYILINRVPSNYNRTDAEEINNEWNMVTDRWKEDGIFVSSFVFPSEGFLIFNKKKNVQKGSFISNDLKIVSTIIIKATDYQEAIKLSKECPHYKQMGTVEVRELMSRIPK